MQRKPITLGGDGVKLTGDAAGDPAAPPLVLLHGGGQTRHSWGRAVTLFAERGMYAIALDMRGHGESERASDGNYQLEGFAADVRAFGKQLSGPPVLVGASLGGLCSLLAVTEPPVLAVRGLVLVDVVPRVEVEGAGEIKAFMRSAPDGFASLDEAADAVARYLPHRPRPKDTSGLQRNLRHGADGRWRWHWDPRMMDGSRRTATEEKDRLESAARRLTGIPTLLVRGRGSRVVSEEGAREFLALAPHAEYVDVAGAEHMVAGDQNDKFNAAVADFVARLP